MSNIEEDSSAVSRRLQQAYMEEYGPSQTIDDQRSDADASRSGHALSPERMTARQKLERANANAAPPGRATEPPVTPEEISEATGMNLAEIQRLRPQERLARANEALARRRKR